MFTILIRSIAIRTRKILAKDCSSVLTSFFLTTFWELCLEHCILSCKDVLIAWMNFEVSYMKNEYFLISSNFFNDSRLKYESETQNQGQNVGWEVKKLRKQPSEGPHYTWEQGHYCSQGRGGPGSSGGRRKSNLLSSAQSMVFNYSCYWGVRIWTGLGGRNVCLVPRFSAWKGVLLTPAPDVRQNP